MGDELVAVIPVKRLDQAKSRLAGRLAPAERAGLVIQLLQRVLKAANGSTVVGHCLVVSSDAAVREYAEQAGVLAVDEAWPGGGQNRALEWGREIAMDRWNPAALLVVSGDLPLITAADLDAIGRLGSEDGTVVLAPDHRGSGTNAISLRPPDLLHFRFGPDSRRAHTAEAGSRGLQVAVYQGIGTSVDLDLPEDLDRFGSIGEIAHGSSRQWHGSDD